MAHVKSLFCCLLVLLLLITAIPVYAVDSSAKEAEMDSSASYVRIKNKWKSNYLYEDSSGIVRYGFTRLDDRTSHWLIEDYNGNKRLKNRATGHYVTVAETTQRMQALTSREITVSTLDDQWVIENSSRAGFYIIKSAKEPSSNLVIHQEDQLGFAEASGDINVTFESPQWAFEPVQEGVPVRIANQYRAGQYLYEDTEGFVKYGETGITDTTSHWYLEVQSENDDGTRTVRIKNRATGHYITQGVDWAQIKALPLDPNHTALSEWLIGNADDPAFITFKNMDALSSGNTYVLNTQYDNDKNVRSNNWAQPEWGSAKWKIESATDIMPVRIVNFTTEAVGATYLYEDQGIVKYGALDSTKANKPEYLWILEDFDGKKRILNLHSGNYITSQNIQSDTDPLQVVPLAVGEATYQWLIANSTIYDDYKTIQSAADPTKYIHVKDQTGSGQTGIVDPESNPAQWLFEDPAASTDGTPQYVRIQNEWQSLFLYEDPEGNLKYGNARKDDHRDQWLVERFNGRKRIKNRETGHYINMENMTDGHIRVTEVEDNWTSAVWVVEDIGGGTRLIHNVQDKNDVPGQQKYIHLQNLTKYAEYGVINPNWGSPHWRFVPVADKGPTNIRLKNKATGQYMYEVTLAGDDLGKVKYGDLPESDHSSIWFLEDTGDGVGSVRLKNLKTGHYLAMENVAPNIDMDAPPQQISAVGQIYPSWSSAKWYMQDAFNAGHSVLKSAWAGHYIYADENGYTKVSKLVAAEENAQFTVIPVEISPELPVNKPIRIKSAETNQYLYENNGGVVMYGNLAENNGYSQWVIETVEGVQRIKNRATGHYMAISSDYRFIESIPISESNIANTQWAVESSPDGAAFMIRSGNEIYNDEYVNVQNRAGYAERALYPNTYRSMHWSFDEAPEQFETPPMGEKKNNVTTTPIIDDSNFVRISVKARNHSGQMYLMESGGKVKLSGHGSRGHASQWLLQDFNGRKLLKNRATNHLLALDTGGNVIVSGQVEGNDYAQWTLEDRLGYKTVKNAASPKGLLNQGPDGVRYGGSVTSDEALWMFEPVARDVYYEAKDAFKAGGKITFAVNAQSSGEYKASILYSNASRAIQKLDLYVNGLKERSVSFKPTNKSNDRANLPLEIHLRSGINSVTLQSDESPDNEFVIDSLQISNNVNKSYRGATVPYIRYEAEHASTNGSLIGPSRSYREIASEASGRQAVKLDEIGQYVEFKLAESANSIVLRYVIPDSADGSGLNATLGLFVNGKFKQNLTLTSKYAWEYGSYPWSNDPKQGSAHRFFDEIHALIGDVPAGATIRLQRDALSTADYYIIDLAEMEQVADPLRKPKGFLSVMEFGAKANDGQDDTSAFKAAMVAAKVKHMGVWFPEGTFELRDELLDLSDITIRGAGMWYTTLIGAKFIGKGGDIEVYDLLIDGDLNIRDDGAHTSAFEGEFGPGSVIQNVWIEHTKTGLWLTRLNDSEGYTDGLHMLGMRIRNLMADGINFCVGTRNSMMEQTDIRYPGDDGIAMWSFTLPSTNNTARFNTVSLPWLADNIVVFGGKDNKILDNVAVDTITNGAGIAVSTRFNPVPFTGTTVVERNTLIRTGSFDTGYGVNLGAIWVFASDKDLNGTILIRNNVVLDSTYAGMIVHGDFKVDNVTLQNIVLDGMGTNGIDVTSKVKGTAVLDNVIVRGERISIVSDAADQFSFIEQNEGLASLEKPFHIQLANGDTGPLTMSEGDTERLRIFGTDGKEITAETSVIVQDSNIASVVEQNRLTAKSAGRTTVTVTYQSFSRIYTLEVLTSHSHNKEN